MSNNMTAVQYEAFVRGLPGKSLEGRHLSPGRKGYHMALEVTAVAAIPTRFGVKTYVVGTRTDVDGAGQLNTVRLDAFIPATIKVSTVKDFKPVDLANYYVRPQDADKEAFDHFGFLQELTDPDDIAYAVSVGVVPISQFLVADKVVAKAKKANRKAEEAPKVE